MTDIESLRRGLRASTAGLRSAANALTDTDVVGASGLPGWTRAHVLTHLARHADALVRVTRAAVQNTLVDPYPGGSAGRAREIAEGAARPAREVVDDLHRACVALESLWDGLPDHAWDRPVRSSSGTRPVRASVMSRWIEVEVHRVDLELGYHPVDWPVEFVRQALPTVLAGLPNRAVEQRVHQVWQLCPRDSERSWWVDTTVPQIREGQTDEAPAAADHVVSADGYQLLAWLMGRSAGASSWVVGSQNPVAALALPQYFPYP